MSRFRIFKDIGVYRLWNVWTRSYFLSHMVKRCRRDRSVRDVLQCFRQTFLRPRRTLLLSATAAYHRGDDETPDSCENSISDEDLEELITELDGIEELSRRTLFCVGCGCRLVIDKKHPGIQYCVCKDAQTSLESDGWSPFMEADDVIIWRKEYKPGQGLYAYKVYGRYREVRAEDFAAVQVDGAYRTVWDTAVASLSVVERDANGVPGQAVLHWEVLWPRLFANRDYVYIRRHKEFDVKSKSDPHKEVIFNEEIKKRLSSDERTSVHSNAKRRALEAEKFVTRTKPRIENNKVYIIVSKSCEHPNVPETKNAIRVSEYWSHMVIKTLNGVDQTGMEFVLTYYDEPAVGGLPTGVAAWATGRAAPAYLQRMRTAAMNYRERTAVEDQQDLPDFVPGKVSNVTVEKEPQVNEEDMESSKQGPELNGNKETKTRDQSTQTDDDPPDVKSKIKVDKPSGPRVSKAVQTSTEQDGDRSDDETSVSWWRYLYPLYYFV
ncbi:stAR-related lipid transfer protein 7, mitochondrial isoform X1 [Bombyx mori]|uniref:stAR-related lipid transfer protein 7, mitochondrial isoform X1 n=1 Tax=Bombyx mori TaxID=7091 RepID=UPI002ED5DED2